MGIPEYYLVFELKADKYAGLVSNERFLNKLNENFTWPFAVGRHSTLGECCRVLGRGSDKMRDLGELMAQLDSRWLVGTDVIDSQVSAPAGTFEKPARAWRKQFVSVLIAFDTAVIVGTLTAYTFVGPRSGFLLQTALIGALWWVLLLALRTRSIDQIGAGATEYKRVLNACLLTGGIVAVAAVILRVEQLRPVLLVVLPIGTLGLLVERWMLRRWLNGKARAGCHLSNVVVVGTGLDVAYVQDQLSRGGVSTYRVVGTVIDGSETGSDPAPSGHAGQTPVVPRSYGIESLQMLVHRTGADAVVVAGALSGGSRTVRELCWLLESSETQVIMVSSLTNVAGPRIRMRPVDGLPMMHVDLPSFSGAGFALKRMMDIIGASAALLLFSPLLLALSLMVKRDSPGPVFFAQERVGLRHSRFKMFKFRSMVHNAEQLKDELGHLNQASGVLFKVKEDPRITAAGQWMRRHSLDELPQFFNVLRGEMSLVGPRPPLPDEVAEYTGHTERRLYIKPGLTGLWQVSGRSDLPEEEAIRLDLYYVENWSILGDFMIMWRTLKVMLNGKGAY